MLFTSNLITVTGFSRRVQRLVLFSRYPEAIQVIRFLEDGRIFNELLMMLAKTVTGQIGPEVHLRPAMNHLIVLFLGKFKQLPIRSNTIEAIIASSILHSLRFSGNKCIHRKRQNCPDHQGRSRWPGDDQHLFPHLQECKPYDQTIR